MALELEIGSVVIGVVITIIVLFLIGISFWFGRITAPKDKPRSVPGVTR